MPLALDVADPSMLVETPERFLGLTAEAAVGRRYAPGGQPPRRPDHAEKIPPHSRLAARFAAFQSFRYGVAGELEKSVQTALAARAIHEQAQLIDEWANTVVPLVLIGVYTCLGDFPAAEREIAAALAEPDVADSVKFVLAPGARALARL